MLNTFKNILKWFVLIFCFHVFVFEFVFIVCLNIAIACRLHRLMGRPHKKEWKCSKFLRIVVVHFTDQNWIPKTVYCIRRAMVCKIGFNNCNAKIALLCASMVVIYYVKLFQMGTDRHSSILMPLLLVLETITRNKIN